MTPIYMDYAAATPLDPKVKKLMETFFSKDYFNPSANYLAARNVRRKLEQARADVANCLGAKPTEIIFTAGATEANNLAIQGIMRAFPAGEILVSTIEHESVLEPAKLFNYRLIPVLKDGMIDVSELKRMISDKTVLVSIGLVNNEIGAIQPINQISDMLNRLSNLRISTRLPLYLHSDAAQAPSYLDVHVSRLGADLVSLNGGKIYGPKQSGVLYIKTGTELQPVTLGGGQEFEKRSGTENVPGDIGLSAALQLAQKHRKKEASRLSRLRELFIRELTEKLPRAIVNGPNKYVSPHILSVSFPNYDNERLMMQLDEAGIQVATGSACSASSRKSSYVLAAIGLSDDLARSTLRFSLGKYTKEKDILQVVNALKRFTTVS